MSVCAIGTEYYMNSCESVKATCLRVSQIDCRGRPSNLTSALPPLIMEHAHHQVEDKHLRHHRGYITCDSVKATCPRVSEMDC